MTWQWALAAPFIGGGAGALIGMIAARLTRRPINPPRAAPAYMPAHHITLDPRACPVCGDLMPFGIAHVCGRGADYRPERKVA